MGTIKRNDEKIRDWVIYLITSPSGRKYIGKTCNYKQRVRQYRNSAKSQKLLCRSFEKYGFDSHVFDIIETFNGNLSMANSKEMFWIRTYMSNINKFKDYRGMNLTDGGEGQIGRTHSQETRDKLKKAHVLRTKYAKGWKHTDEMKKQMSTVKKGKPIIGKRRGWTMEQKKEMSEMKKGISSARKGTKFVGTPEERKIKFGSHNIGNSYNKGRKPAEKTLLARLAVLSKPVSQYSLNGIFIKEYPSAREAARQTKLSAPTIIAIATGKTNKPRKYLFKYKQDVIFTNTTLQRRIFKQQDLNKKIA